MWAATSSDSSARKAWRLLRVVLGSYLALAVPQAWSTPGKVEVWFLIEAASKTTYVPELRFPMKTGLVSGRSLAANDYDANCLPMGDGCFNPQTGYVPKDPAKSVFPEDIPSKEGDADWKTKVFSADEVSMVDCKKDYYFDVFCGQEHKEAAAPASGFEVWIDTSGSLRGIDTPSGNDICFRRSFAEKLRDKCEGKVNFYAYNDSKKHISTLDSACMTKGGNDPDRLMRWIRESNAKELIIITDVAEHSEKFEVFLDSIGGSMRGLGAKPMKAKDLDSLLPEAVKSCP